MRVSPAPAPSHTHLAGLRPARILLLLASVLALAPPRAGLATVTVVRRAPQIIFSCDTEAGGSCGHGAYILDGVYNFNAQVSVDSGGPTDQEVAEIDFVAGAMFDVVRTITLIPDPDGPGPGRARLEGPIVEVVVELLQAEAFLAEAAPIGFQVARIYEGGWGSDLAGESLLFDTVVSRDDTVMRITTPPGQRTYLRDFPDPDAAEIDSPGQIPTGFALWQDFEPPFALDYRQPAEFEQTFSDVLRVSFRLRAESRPSGSISTNGGEAMACVGRESDRSFFTLNDDVECHKDVQIRVNANVVGVVTQDVSNVPEVAGSAAGVTALGTLLWSACRRRRWRVAPPRRLGRPA